VQRPLGQGVAGEKVGRGTGGRVDEVLGGDQAAEGVERTVDDDEQGPLPGLGQVQGRLEEDAGQVGPADRLGPRGELLRRVEHPPAAVREGERLGPVGEELDLLVRAQDDADVSRDPGRPGVRGIGPGAGDLRLVPVGHPRGPPGDVDDVDEPPLAVDEEDRPLAVAELVDALEPRQLDPIRQGVGRARRGEVAGPSRRTPVETRRFS
jgi:hypothetical protein